MADSPTRVLLVAAANATSGGGEKHIADLLHRLPALGIELGLLVPPGGDLGGLASSLNVPVYTAPIHGGFSAARVQTVRSAIADFAPDLVHAHGSRAAAFARIADPRAAERVIYTIHGIHVDRAGRRARRTALLGIERTLRSRTAHFVLVCESDLRRGVRLGIVDWPRSRVVYNGIELPQPSGTRGAFRAELGVADGALLIVCIGRLVEQKDQATLVEAFAEVASQHPDAVLVLVGSGPLEGDLRTKALSRGVLDRVRFVRPRAAIADVYADADIVALSSRWEGLPYTVLEAMAHGKPIVSTDVDGIPEAIENGVSGLLVEPGQPAAFAKALGRVLGAPDQAAALGEAAAQRVAHRFSLDRMVDEIVATYTEVLGR